MTRSIKNRIASLEGQRRPDTDHEYTAVIPFGEPLNDQGPKYYRDGVEISRSEYLAAAPRDQGIEIVLGPPIPKREATGSARSEF